RSCNDPGGHPHLALGAAPGPACAGAALLDLVRAGLAVGGTGRVRVAAAAVGPGAAAQHAPRRVLGRAAGAGLVLARRDGRLVASPGALVRTAGNGACAGGRVRGQRAGPACAIQPRARPLNRPVPGNDPRDPRMAALSQAAIERMHAAARAIRDGDAAGAQRLLHSVLGESPEHPEAMRLLAVLHLRGRRPDLARGLLLRAVARKPGDAMLHNDLASARMACGEEQAAFDQWRTACELAPGEPMPWFNLGRNLQARGMGAEALAPLQRACELAPELLPATILLGDALLHLGRIDEAVARYRAALDVDPGCGDAWRGLANVRTRPLENADIETMQAQLRRPELRDLDRVAIGHTLGRALEDRGEFAAAFSALRDANALQRQRAPWSARAFLDYVEAALDASASLPEPLDPGLGSEAIFIVGLPRSGST